MSALTIASAIYDFGFVLFHLLFWRLFGWPVSLAPSGTVNAAITQTLNLMLSYCLVTYGVALLWVGSVDGILALAGSGFWLLRAVAQPILFSLRPPFSIALTALFVCGALLHAAVALL